MDNNISELLLRIKENIQAIEGGDTRKPLLDEVRSDYFEFIEYVKLFLISERDSYYGYFLMNMQFSVNYNSDSIAGIKLNTFPPVFEANPLLLCKFKLKEIIYIVCHEIDHIVLNHPAEMVKANPECNDKRFYEFNLAADASVNDRINYEIDKENHSFMTMPEGCITSSSISKMYNIKNIVQMENYAYYFNLIEEKVIDKKNKNNDTPSENGQQSMMNKQNEKDNISGDESYNTDEPGDESNDSTLHSDNDNSIVTANNCNGKISDHNWEAGNDVEDATAAVKELVNASVSMMNNETRGLMPGYFLSEVEKVNKPPVLSWQKILKKYVGTITSNKMKTRTRLNRRQPERFDLSGTMDDKVLKIVVAIDSSGSVSDSMISKIINEIFGILAKRKHDITVIECDSKVQKVYKARTTSDIQTKVNGRGGTAFTPVIEYINNNKFYKDALLIYFTDGFGESVIPKPHTYRNMWVIIGNENNLSLEEPYGAVLKL